MIYRCGDVSISVEQIDGFGKKPGLWIGAGNEILKVASFGDTDKSQMFCKWLEYMVGIKDEIPKLNVR